MDPDLSEMKRIPDPGGRNETDLYGSGSETLRLNVHLCINVYCVDTIAMYDISIMQMSHTVTDNTECHMKFNIIHITRKV